MELFRRKIVLTSGFQRLLLVIVMEKKSKGCVCPVMDFKKSYVLVKGLRIIAYEFWLKVNLLGSDKRKSCRILWSYMWSLLQLGVK